MRPMSSLTLFSSCVSILILQPLVLAALMISAPQLAVRQNQNVASICGYYSLNGLSTLTCASGTPCLTATALSPAVGYCSRTDNVPVTTIFPWGSWPTQGCGPGSACCTSTLPSIQKFLFNGGSTVVLGCGLTATTLSAFTSSSVPITSVPASKTPTTTAPTTTTSTTTTPTTTTPTTTAPTTTAPTTTAPTTTTPTTTPPTPAISVTPQPSQSNGTSGMSNTVIVIIAAAVVALISGIISLWFLWMAWKLHHSAKYPPQRPLVSSHDQNSNPSLDSTPTAKKGRLSRVKQIVGILSGVLTIVGVVVSLTYGLKHR